MNTLNPREEFVVGKHGIGWIDSDFFDRVGTEEFTEVEGMPKFQKLSQSMTDAEIENELKPGICTLADVLAFLKNAPEESKDGYWNLFYLKECVVFVVWGSVNRGWNVSTWRRVGSRWLGGHRVFSPATDPRPLGSVSSDTLPLVLEINGFTYRRI